MKESYVALIAVAAIVAVAGVSVMSTTGGNQTDGIIPDNGNSDTGLQTGEEATLSFATFDATQSSQTQVASNVYLWDESSEATVLLEKDSNASDRTEFDMETGDQYSVAAFGSTHPYGTVEEGNTVESTSVNKNLDVYEDIAGSSEFALEVRDGGEEVTSNVSLVSGEEKTLDNVYMQVRDSEKSFNAGMVLVDEPADVDVTLEDSDLSSVDVPNADSLSNYDRAYEISGTSAKGEPALTGFEEMTADTIFHEAGDGLSDTTQDVEIAVVDTQPFINADNELAGGVIDDDENLNGQTISTTYTLDLAP